MNDRVEIDSHATVPTLKRHPSEKLFIGGMKENLKYIFKGYKNKDLGTDDGLKVGDKFSLNYDFSPYDSGYFAYEHLNLFAGKSWIENGKIRIHNWVKYFNGIESAELFINGLEFELDTQWAFDAIDKKNKEIAKIKQEYSI